jgi:hypothetical protein
MSTKTVKRFISLLLATALTISLACPAFAAMSTLDTDSVKIVDPQTEPEEYARLVNKFTDSANTLKTKRPALTITDASGLEEDGITVTKNGVDSSVAEEAEKYLIPLFDSIFKNKSSISKVLLQTLLGEDTVNFDTVTLKSGESRKYYIPLYGKNTVSELTPEDTDFTLHAYTKSGSSEPYRLTVLYNQPVTPDTSDATTSRAKVFSLSDGKIDPVLISGDVSGDSVLENVKFDDFKYGKSLVNLYFNDDGTLSKYESATQYQFSASMYDLLAVIDAIYKGQGFTFSFLKTGIALANAILSGLDKDTSAEDVLKQFKLNVKYRIEIHIENIDYTARPFGDVDNNLKVTVADARSALRHAIGLETIKDSDDLIYTDVDFNGKIDVKDARLILRMAVHLDEPFTEVPEGEEIKIVIETPPDDTDDDTDDTDDTGDTTDDTPTDLEKLPADVASAVFDIIELVGGETDSFVSYIKQIVEAAKKQS